MSSPTDEIKSRLDIAEVIQGYVRLQKAGRNFKARCPFHGDNDPSFMVSPEKQMWYCFGCGKGGDLFTFIQEIEGMEFPDALRLLAQRAGVELGPEDKQRSSKKKQLLEICELTAKFFEKQRESTMGKKVVAYLSERGLEDATIAAWRLGYAPDEWGALTEFLRKKGYDEGDIERAGLVVQKQEVRSKKQEAEFYDRFRHRIIFPITDIQGRVVGFSGRLFEEAASKTAGKEAAKYINTPNTLLYNKSRALYGLEKARAAMREKDRCILTEGNLDVVLASQAGTPEVVAPCGTAVGEEHIRIIKRYTDNLVLCFDADAAGERASRKSAHIALSEGMSVSAIELPEGADIADIVQKNPRQWRSIAQSPAPFISFIMSIAKKAHGTETPEKAKRFVRDVLASIAAVDSPVEREHWVGELAAEAGVSSGAVQEELARLKRGRVAGKQHPAPAAQPRPRTPEAAEEYFVSLAIRYPEGLGGVGEDAAELLESERLRAIVKRLAENGEVAGSDAATGSLVFAADLIGEIIPADELPREFSRVVSFLRERRVRDELRAIEKKLRAAEREENEQEVHSLLIEFNTLSRKLVVNKHK